MATDRSPGADGQEEIWQHSREKSPVGPPWKNKTLLASRVLSLSMCCLLLNNGNVRCSEPLWAVLNLELDLIALVQGLVPACRDRIEVNKYIFSPLTRNETETLCC